MCLVVIFLKFWGCTMLLICMQYVVTGGGFVILHVLKKVCKSPFPCSLFCSSLSFCLCVAFCFFLRLRGSPCAFIRKQSVRCCCPLHLAAPLACFQPRCLLVQPCCLLFLPFCLLVQPYSLFAVLPFCLLVLPYCLFAVLPFCVAFGNVARNIWLITWRTFHPTAGTLDSPACLLAIDKHAL